MDGRVALVTGVSRRAGIGFAIARRLVGGRRARVRAPPRPARRRPRLGRRPAGIDAVIDAIGGETAHAGFDSRSRTRPRRCWTPRARVRSRRHPRVQPRLQRSRRPARGRDGGDARRPLDGQHARVAAARPGVRRATTTGAPGGRIVIMTSGQNLGPMPEIAYAVVQGRAGGDHALDRRRARRPRHHRQLREPRSNRHGLGEPRTDGGGGERRCPLGAGAQPDDAARLIAWLVSEEGRWMTGQVLNSEGGFRR